VDNFLTGNRFSFIHRRMSNHQPVVSGRFSVCSGIKINCRSPIGAVQSVKRFGWGDIHKASDTPMVAPGIAFKS
jgi:hypothetical protein